MIAHTHTHTHTHTHREDTAAHVVTKTARGMLIYSCVDVIIIIIAHSTESRDHYSEVYVNGTIGES